VDNQEFKLLSDIPAVVEVTALPFLGILVPCSLVARIGLPDAGYFIAGDDTEYCFRARNSGARICAVSTSRLKHPPSAYYRFGIGRFSPVCFRMSPWKRYYEVRNRILTSWQVGYANLIFLTIPAALLRLTASLIHEEKKGQQLKAHCAGIIDGVLKRRGVRHGLWHIPGNDGAQG
jgi:GT2 family glycosyltransferase